MSAERDIYNWHGTSLRDKDGLEEPRCTNRSQKKARKGGSTTKSEYYDAPSTLRLKVNVLCALIQQSKHFVVYTGAGISTAAGIQDYASSKSKASKQKVLPRHEWMEAKPTYSHFALTALHKAKLLKHWIQQNHDGLAQKAGFPQSGLTEIHGSWFDPSNLVVTFDGDLRADLIENLEKWELKCDLCLCMGTSLSGMAADSIAEKADVLVIVNLQKTEMDDSAAVRIFADLDAVNKMVVKKLGVRVSTKPYSFKIPKLQRSCNVYYCPYDCKGKRIKKCSKAKRMRWDLRKGQQVTALHGDLKGVVGTVVDDYGEGYYKMKFIDQGSREMMIHVMGPWWIEAAIRGELKYMSLL